MRTEIIISGRKLHVETGHYYPEWFYKYKREQNLWDFDIAEFITGAVEFQEDMLYWLIKGRCYETDIFVEE